jgi:hypothetical protein
MPINASPTGSRTVTWTSMACPTSSHCTAPPISANFYPYWSLSKSYGLGSHVTSCAWNIGAQLPNTVANLGKDAQYGTPDLSWYGGTNISPVQPNPEFSKQCSRSS